MRNPKFAIPVMTSLAGLILVSAAWAGEQPVPTTPLMRQQATLALGEAQLQIRSDTGQVLLTTNVTISEQYPINLSNISTATQIRIASAPGSSLERGSVEIAKLDGHDFVIVKDGDRVVTAIQCDHMTMSWRFLAPSHTGIATAQTTTPAIVKADLATAPHLTPTTADPSAHWQVEVTSDMGAVLSTIDLPDAGQFGIMSIKADSISGFAPSQRNAQSFTLQGHGVITLNAGGKEVLRIEGARLVVKRLTAFGDTVPLPAFEGKGLQ